MKIVRTAARAAQLCRMAGRPLVLVPTMGALHAGHVSLMRRARKLAGAKGAVVVSIFVNPTQFGPKEDFTRYPRPFARDCRLCREAGVDVVFHPDAADMYGEGYSTYVDEELMSRVLCGSSRPGHFRGVCTVVLKLFNITGADVAIFGEKDYQQVAVIRRMVRDLNVPIRIVTAPTVRERDGLAMSSRNVYLSEEQRGRAPVIRRALLRARDASYRTPGDLERMVRKEIEAAGAVRIDYVEVLDAGTLGKVGKGTRELVIACAVFFGRTRLIDNVTRRVSRRPARIAARSAAGRGAETGEGN